MTATNILTALLVNSAVFAALFGLMLIVRKLMAKRISAVLQYVLWALVVIKLVVPFGFESALSPFGLLASTDNTSPVITQNDSGTDQALSVDNAIYAGAAQPETAPSADTVITDTGTALQQNASGSPEVKTVGTAKPVDWTVVALGVWAAGMLAAGTLIALDARKLRRGMRRENAVPTARVLRVFKKCKRELGVRRHVDVVTQSAVNVPLAMGAFHPVLVLPEDIDAADDAQLRHVCLHELAHVKYGDLTVICILNVLCCLYWFNPFVWLCFRFVRKDMETACDARVLHRLGSGARQEYIGTVLQFAAREDKQQMYMGFPKRRDAFWGEKAAMGMADGRLPMEQRVRGMFRKPRTGLRGRVIAVSVAVLMLTASVLTACQPTPSEPVVIGKGDGAMESAINQNSGNASSAPYDSPERLTLDVGGLPDDYIMNFDAGVDVSDQTEWPVYSMEPTKITQNEADAVRNALLDGAVLYKPGKYRSRAEIQRSIDYYENELRLSEGYQQTTDAYQEILKNLYIEYESSPEDLKLEEADTKLQFMENRVDAWDYGGKEVKTEDGGFRYEWTDEARQRAIEAGCGNIYGVCWTESGRKMSLSLDNNERSSNLYYTIDDGNLIADPGVTYPLDEAVSKADDLLKKAGLDFTLVEATTETDLFGRVNEDKGPWYHSLVYKRRIEGVPQDNIVSLIAQRADEDNGYMMQNTDEQFRPVPQQETIRIDLDDYGVRMFIWSQPWKVTALENPNVDLLPFDIISERITKQLKMQTLWDEMANEREIEWIDSRRLEVNKVAMSYLVVAKKDDMTSYYLIPVWNVCGDMYYHYKDSYPTGKSNTYVLDENNERLAWRSRYQTGEYSILTINAIDGTVIPRGRDG